MNPPLKLRAVDRDDMAVVASILQDAVIPLEDMKYLPGERRFALVATRFRWENCDETKAECDHYERVNCGLTFEGVTAVKIRGLDRADRQRILELLTIEVEDGALKLVFAGDGAVRLEVERVFCILRDLGEPWPTQWRPSHPAVDKA